MGWNWQLCFQKCIIHNIQTWKMWTYFYTCLWVPFNWWEDSGGHRGCGMIDLNYRRFYGSWNWQLCFQKCIMNNTQAWKMWYYFYTCLRVPFNRWEQSWGCRGHRTIDLNDRRVLCVETDNYASENPLYTIYVLGKCGIILIHASEYPSTSGSTAGAVAPIIQSI